MSMDATYLKHLKTCLDVSEGKVDPAEKYREKFNVKTEKAPTQWALSNELTHISETRDRLENLAEAEYKQAIIDLKYNYQLALAQISDDASLAKALARAILGTDEEKKEYAVNYVRSELAAWPEADNTGDLEIYVSEDE